jgi:phospholipid transport system substrate-binding protein
MRAKLLLGLALLVFCLTPVLAASDTGPREQTRVTVDRVLDILKNKELKKPGRARERRALIRREVGAIFDFKEMSRRSLGQHWSQRTASEKEEFTALFSDLLERTYISKIEGYSNEKIYYDEQTVDGRHAVLKTRIVTAKGVSVPVIYRYLKNGAGWRVYDVVIEGVSLVNNYRTQFNKIIQRESYRGLVRKLKNKGLQG